MYAARIFDGKKTIRLSAEDQRTVSSLVQRYFEAMVNNEANDSFMSKLASIVFKSHLREYKRTMLGIYASKTSDCLRLYRFAARLLDSGTPTVWIEDNKDVITLESSGDALEICEEFEHGLGLLESLR